MDAYSFKEMVDFEPLMPKVMELLGDDKCIGYSDVVVSTVDPKMAADSLVPAVDSMKVVSVEDIME